MLAKVPEYKLLFEEQTDTKEQEDIEEPTDAANQPNGKQSSDENESEIKANVQKEGADK